MQQTDRKFPRLILVFLAVDWPLFMRKKMIYALAESARKFDSTIIAVNRPLCPITTIMKKRSRIGELFRKAEVEKLADNLFLFSPKYVIHDHFARRFDLLEKLNIKALRRGYKYLMDQIGIREPRPVVWYYYPQQGYVSKLFKNNLVVYDIYDNLVDIYGRENPQLTALQKKQINDVDLLLASSQKLYDKYAASYKLARIIGNGLDRETFERLTSSSADIETIPEIMKIKSPRIGYTGLISERLDYNLISALAELRPDYNFIFVGKVISSDAIEIIRPYDNVYFLGMYDHDKIPSVLKSFDVGFMPYLDNEFFRYSNPLKFYEFAAAGLPSVSSNMEELGKFPPEIVRILPNDQPKEWIDAIEQYIEADRDNTARLGREIASQYVWENITENLLKYINANIFD